MPGSPSFCVRWNQIAPMYILFTSHDNVAFVIEIIDYPTCKNIALKKGFDHPSHVYGCSWSPINANEFVTACQDGILRMFNFAADHTVPIKTFEGHTLKIFNVIHSTILPTIMASASDDKSICIWRTDGDSTPMSICGGANVKNSHTQNVRALSFVPDIPFALLSGSWDATIKMWDIRNGNHLWTITDHCSDVYGITLHPSRPFVFSSCSRDTSIRTFIIDGFIQSLKINFLTTKDLNESQLKMVDNPENTFASKGTFKLCSPYA